GRLVAMVLACFCKSPLAGDALRVRRVDCREIFRSSPGAVSLLLMDGRPREVSDSFGGAGLADRSGGRLSLTGVQDGSVGGVGGGLRDSDRLRRGADHLLLRRAYLACRASGDDELGHRRHDSESSRRILFRADDCLAARRDGVYFSMADQAAPFRPLDAWRPNNYIGAGVRCAQTRPILVVCES